FVFSDIRILSTRRLPESDNLLEIPSRHGLVHSTLTGGGLTRLFSMGEKSKKRTGYSFPNFTHCTNWGMSSLSPFSISPITATAHPNVDTSHEQPRNRCDPVPDRGRRSSFHWQLPPGALGFRAFGPFRAPATYLFVGVSRRRAARPASFLR